MARELKSVKITHGSLDESPLRGGTTILRGVIDPDSLKHLQVDDYQREALPLSSLRKLTTAIQGGEVLPDVEIGMRGDRVNGGKDTFYLQDDCYIIDGQQRVNACLNTLLQGGQVHLGTVVHFNTTKEWERDRFRILNSDRIKVSPNILIRNIRSEHPSIQMIYSMTDAANSQFCLAGRVCWSQKMNRGELITAMTLVRTLGCLHTHISAGKATAFGDLASQLDAIAEKITPGMMKDNIRTFFDLIDQAWGVRTVKYRELSRHLSGSFLWTVARVLTNHTDFWKNAADGRLFIDADLKRKFGSFPISDPGISQLMAAGGTAGNLLYDHMVQHLNSGRRTNRLKVRASADRGSSEDANTEAA